ncbi:hypothetical protein DPMN_075519 [Dreissena polymorpha]|uniref:Uncharacterized protein n=1 Tax=Dreissena polymorpha TaxID=45954 RepID=A0A9D3YJQ9_DREPO|nr:hypothetical protein DPMN_075519 [Dreissena polymorpha]
MGDEAPPAAAKAAPAKMPSLIPFPGKLAMDGYIAKNWKNLSARGLTTKKHQD